MNIREVARALDSLAYWEGVSECVCAADRPFGACLYCDCRQVRKVVDSLVLEVQAAVMSEGRSPSARETAFDSLSAGCRNGS
jgi:hypothetical protein